MRVNERTREAEDIQSLKDLLIVVATAMATIGTVMIDLRFEWSLYPCWLSLLTKVFSLFAKPIIKFICPQRL